MIVFLNAVFLIWAVAFLLIKMNYVLNRQNKMNREIVTASRGCLSRLGWPQDGTVERAKEEIT